MSSAGICISTTNSVSRASWHVQRRRHGASKRTACCACTAAGPELLDAAKLVVDNFVKNGMVVGLGCGCSSALAIHHIGARLKDGTLKGVVGVPSSVFSATEASKAGIPLNNYDPDIHIDLAFTDADLVEDRTLAAIIGRRKLEGGDSFLEEKSIAKSAAKLALIVSENRYTAEIDGSVPVLISSGNWMETAEEIDDLFLGDAEVWRRSAFGYAGPTGGDFPLTTKEGHNVLDVVFTSPITYLDKVAESLEKVAGVIAHGIILSTNLSQVVIASEKGAQMISK